MRDAIDERRTTGDGQTGIDCSWRLCASLAVNKYVQMTDRRSSIDDQCTIIVRVYLLTIICITCSLQVRTSQHKWWIETDARSTTDNGQTVVIRITWRHSWIWDLGLRRRSNRGVDNCVGAGFDRTYVDEVYSDIGDVVGEGFELEVGDEVDSWYVRS